MKCLVLLGLALAALLQVEARSIGMQTQEMPKALKDIMQQSFACGMELGASKMKGLPNVAGLKQYPEDNEALNALWGCIFKKKGIVNEHSDINEEHLESYLWDVTTMLGQVPADYKNKIHDLTLDCMNVHGSDYGQTAVKIQNCAMRLSMEQGLRK